MKIEITERRRNPIMGREELEFEVSESKATPSRKDLAEMLASKTGKEQSLVVVKKISSEYGSMRVLGKASVYDTKRQLGLAESEYMRLRQIGQKKPKKEKKLAKTPEKK